MSFSCITFLDIISDSTYNLYYYRIGTLNAIQGTLLIMIYEKTI
jgi:hypothetical protein